jgi:Trk K+ transport system NAD-binding subunit
MTMSFTTRRRSTAEVFDKFPELLVAAIIRKQQIHLPRGSTGLEAGDQLLIAASDQADVETFMRAMAGSARWSSFSPCFGSLQILLIAR